MSSSRSGQWIPWPPPINRQEVRSFAVPCTRRGYQASGTAMVRPSASSTDKVSAVTFTCVATVLRFSLVLPTFGILLVARLLRRTQLLHLRQVAQAPQPVCLQELLRRAVQHRAAQR